MKITKKLIPTMIALSMTFSGTLMALGIGSYVVADSVKKNLQHKKIIDEKHNLIENYINTDKYEALLNTNIESLNDRLENNEISQQEYNKNLEYLKSNSFAETLVPASENKQLITDYNNLQDRCNETYIDGSELTAQIGFCGIAGIVAGLGTYNYFDKLKEKMKEEEIIQR
ncbi:MAG: hypothetical protein IJX26_02320 [Clostridia bacterium]|nr:hypothetical protein [Clostridia bacterium]